MSPDFQSRPPKEASAFFKAKKLQPSFDWQDVWRDEHSKAFTVARTTQIDVLSDIQAALQKALDEGKTFADFKKELTPILVKKGWWGIKEQTDPQTGEVKKVRLGTPRRLKTIYWANMASARSAGQWERAQRTKAALPYFMYTQTSSAEPRPEHLEWVGTILPIDHEWWHTHMTPNGWGCKCQVRQISRYEAERRGGVTKNPTIYPPKTYRRKLPNGDYEVTRVTGGIDPGWDNNPGLARDKTLQDNFEKTIKKAAFTGADKSLLRQFLETKINLPPPQAQGGVKLVNQTGDFAAAIDKKETGVFQGIYQAPDYLKTYFKDDRQPSPLTSIMLSTDTVISKLDKHPEFKNLRDLEVISQALLRWHDAVEVRVDSRGHISIFGKYKMAGRKQWDLWHLVIKQTNAGEYIITTAHRTDEKRIMRFRKRSDQIHGLDILKLERK